MRLDKLDSRILELICCPYCKGKLESKVDQFICIGCYRTFPIIDDVPILINEDASVFRISDFVKQKDIFFNTTRSKFHGFLSYYLPNLSLSLNSKKNFEIFIQNLLLIKSNPRVLILGCGVAPGVGISALLSHPSIEVVETDVSWGSAKLICDSHDIPFIDRSFDGVVAQAVLEHVMSPYRCVEEIYRVLDLKGLVYAETPFMQQVHGGRYDFTRFTELGHRCLFRWFFELDRGLLCGPGMALAWSYQYFLLSFTKSKILRSFIRVFARLTSFFLKYFDYLLINSPSALDAASGVYFLGRKMDAPLSERELLNTYMGVD